MKLASAIIAHVFLLGPVTAQDPTWMPGDFSQGKVVEDTERGTKIFLSNGLMGKAFAWNGEPVVAANGTQLAAAYHEFCDGGATFAKPDGGYYYVSNSEFGAHPNEKTGGAYSMEFTSDHMLVAYKQVLSNTAKNCHGGVTPWDTWISCEEEREYGQCWQVDPAGEIESAATMLATSNTPDFGNWEAFAWDDESDPPRGYVTNDDFPDDVNTLATRGAVIRFTPDATALECYAKTTKSEQWCTVESGTHEYLKITPNSEGATKGTFEWVTEIADSNPAMYGGSEGAHVEDGIFTFSTVLDRYLFRLNLAEMTYVRSAVPFTQEPDNLRFLGERLYLCTDGDAAPGDALWGWDKTGAYRIFYEENHNYPAGVDFTPDKKMMYVSLYSEATWQFWREDGLAFDDPVANIKYEVQGGYDEGKTHEELGISVVDDSGSSSNGGGSSDSGGGTADPAPNGGDGSSGDDTEGTDGSSANAVVTALAGLMPFAALL